jgi:hypothetical protein
VKRKAWHEIEGSEAVRLGSEVRASAPPLRFRPRRRNEPVRLGECLLYPLADGPGIALLVFFPPLLWIMSLPIFDVIAFLEPLTRGNWALGLLVLPIFLPMLISFALVFGYALLFLGQILVSSAMGDPDHPRWPEWNSQAISEGLGRWMWAGVVGLVIGGLPVPLYWKYCGDIDWFDRIVFAELVILGTGYAQLALAAALLHDSLVAANPLTVVLAVARLGWDYVQPCLSAGVALILAAGVLGVVLFAMPDLMWAVFGLWAFWVFVLYEAMVVFRMLGLTYYCHAGELAWFSRLPKWGLPPRFGRIYSNS